MRDCYYRLEQPLKVDSTFFVGIKLVASPTNQFALCHTDVKLDGRNTAFFKDASGWHSFEENHPYYNQPTSLFIEPVVQVGGTSFISVTDHSANEPSSIVIPNPVDEMATVRFSSTKNVLYYEWIDMEGRLARKVPVNKRGDELSLHMDLPSGIYLLRLVCDSTTEILRVVKK
jgi:hypothetical protein